MTCSNVTRFKLASPSSSRYHPHVDTTGFLIPLLMLPQLSGTPPHIEQACAHTYDPPACYDEWQATKNADDAIMMGNWNAPTPTTGSFYHYIDTPPMPTVDSPICDDTPFNAEACY